jgi:hypothetical protein
MLGLFANVLSSQMRPQNQNALTDADLILQISILTVHQNAF